MIRVEPRRSTVRRLEILGLCPIALALVAASTINWRTIDGPLRPMPIAGSTPPRIEDVAPGQDASVSPFVHVAGSREPEFDEPMVVAPSPASDAGSQSSVRLPVLRHIVAPSRPADPPTPPEERRVRVGDERGHSLVARSYGGRDSNIVLLPDGSLGWPNVMIDTGDPFQPLDGDGLLRALSAGPYRHFQAFKTDHYVIFHTSSAEFARQSGTLLESLYHGLMRTFQAHGIEVHEAEFPLVAIIYRNELEFREQKDVDPDVQATYEAVSNRIFFYETRLDEPESCTATRKPQTVAHEGTHQVLQNIGVHPRLARWPLWLVEGLAEYCAPSITLRGEWAGCGRMNPLHLATLREIEEGPNPWPRPTRFVAHRTGGSFDRKKIRDLFAKSALSPTDYARSWALVHYLATKRSAEFDAYLQRMSRSSPLARVTDEERFDRFRDAFARDFDDLGSQVLRHAMSQRCGVNLPYYAVMFEQVIDDQQVRRGTIVSQSPLIVQQWLEEMMDGGTFPPVVIPLSFPTRSAAFQAAQVWRDSR